MKKLILASNSPRRKEIFGKLYTDFQIIPSSYDEVLENHIFTYEKIENLAYNKALAVVKQINYSAIVVGADTVVVLDNNILGKPKDRDEAFKMLKDLSGKEHFVVTSICAIDSENMNKNVISTTSYVEFEELSEDLINYYLDTFKPFDKAGSYGIQELPQGFVKNVRGSFENIVGLCPKALEKTLSVFKL